jgi:hypothetical protein
MLQSIQKQLNKCNVFQIMDIFFKSCTVGRQNICIKFWWFAVLPVLRTNEQTNVIGDNILK